MILQDGRMGRDEYNIKTLDDIVGSEMRVNK